jgi:hypothetical protein
LGRRNPEMYSEKPTGVTIIAALFFIAGALMILIGLYVLAVPLPWIPGLTSYQVTIGIGAIVVGGATIAAGWGLWTLQNWGRITAVVLLGLGAVSALTTGVGLLMGINLAGYPLYFPGPGIVALLLAGIGAWSLWYLLKSEVADVFYGVALAPVPPTASTAPPPPTPAPAPSVPRSPARPRRQPTVSVDAQPAPEAWLVLRTGTRAGKQFGLRRGRNTVGRDPSQADIVLEDETVSGEHARVQFEQGQFYITDLASTNGTYINNKRVQRQLLMDGDLVRFGSAELVFKRVD